LEAAAQRLLAGGLVAFPTETVYGLGARADDAAAVAAIFAAKGRPADHPLIVHVADLAGARRFSSRLGPSALALMARFWPGPLTVIVPRDAGIGTAAAGGQDSIGLRSPSHPLAQALLQRAAELGVPGVAGPSANRFGRVSPTAAAHVLQEFGPDLPVLDGGPCQVGIESTIVDCTREPPTLLRPGAIGLAEIEELLGLRLRQPDAASPRASGTLIAHYAPHARLQLMPLRSLAAALDALPREGRPAVAVYSQHVPAVPGLAAHRLMPADARAVARELFSVLRSFDDAGAGQIWVECPPADPAWDGVNDRLRRAAAA
jgi:L-threonylcarbamoyladenylate synthase